MDGHTTAKRRGLGNAAIGLDGRIADRSGVMRVRLSNSIFRYSRGLHIGVDQALQVPAVRAGVFSNPVDADRVNVGAHQL